MFKIIWRKRGFSRGGCIIQWTHGVSRYDSTSAAQLQADRFKATFHDNDYHVVPA